MRNLKYFCLAAMAMMSEAAAQSQKADVAGSKDHPVVSRFKGSYIRFYEYNKYNDYTLRMGPIERSKPDGGPKKILSGELTRIVYQAPATVSAAEMYKSYEQALLQAGFSPLFACTQQSCGDGFGYDYPNDNAPHIKSFTKDQRYWAGSRQSAESNLFVSIYTVYTHDGPVARLDLVEVKDMEEGQVTVTAAQLLSELDRLGKAVVNQIYFESGSARLLPTSGSALQQIAEVLRQNIGKKFFVVGHTDSDGGLEMNMQLSLQRAEAVTRELVSRYGISSDQLAAKGVGYLCPVAANTSARGKAKNRRVEIVFQ